MIKTFYTMPECEDVYKYNGTEVEIIGEVPEDSYDKSINGIMYSVRCNDGNIITVYEDELFDILF